jgi:hypothetical protein
VEDLCLLCAARAASTGCAVCGDPVRPGTAHCVAHGAGASTAALDPGDARSGAAGPASDRLHRWGRTVRTPVLAAAAIVGFNLVFPILVANQRPTVLSQSGTISAAAAATSHPESVSVSVSVPAWDQVDVELFVDACGQSEPPVVCQCQVQALQPYYSGEQAQAYAYRQGHRAVLPAHYKDVLVRCSQGY